MRSTLIDPAKPRFLLLDFLRIIGAVAVLFYHYTARQHAQWGEAPSDAFPVLSLFSAYGFLGVHLFFLLISPPDRPGDHLRALENISRQLRDDTFCRFLKQAKSVEDIQLLLDEADNNQFGS